MDLPDWLNRAAPSHLAAILARGASPRKAGLFVRHLCRCFPDAFPDPRSRAALDAADEYVDEEVEPADFTAAILAAEEAHREAHATYHRAASESGPPRDFRSVAAAAGFAREVAVHGYQPNMLSGLRHVVLDLTGTGGGPRKNPIAPVLRPVFYEHFGDPLRPVTCDPSWLTSTVTALARGIYDERAFDRLPILADALQDAGCDHPAVLAHCRSDTPHVRGCWVVDLLLGKG